MGRLMVQALFLFADNSQNIYNYRRRQRGVAQLVAYVLWEHGVASSSLVTSTTDYYFKAAGIITGRLLYINATFIPRYLY